MLRPHTATLEKATTVSRGRAPREKRSLLGRSAASRLAGAAGAVALLWAAVYWALS